MPVSPPNFSPFPFAALPRFTRGQAQLATVIARWARAKTPVTSARLDKLLGGTARIRVLGVGAASAQPRDPHAAIAELRVQGLSCYVTASSLVARTIAARAAWSPDELAAPRPLTHAELALFSLAVATALVDAQLPGEVWPVLEPERAHAIAASYPLAVELALDVGATSTSVSVWCPGGLRVAAAPAREWSLAMAVQLGACALHQEDVARLAIGDLVTIERQLALVIGDVLVPLEAAAGSLDARVASDYVRRDMALPDEAHLELTVQLGTTRLSLRQLADLAPGAIVPLGRPLAGPFDVRAAGRLVGQGELVDVDGELGVRIVSLQE